MNLEYMSKVILTGTLYRRTISCIYLSTKTTVDCPTLKGKNYADFVKRSIITHTALFPLGLLGNAMTKPILICSQFHCGIGNGCSNPPSRWCSALTYWHTKIWKHILQSSFSFHSTKSFASSLYTSSFRLDGWNKQNWVLQLRLLVLLLPSAHKVGYRDTKLYCYRFSSLFLDQLRLLL